MLKHFTAVECHFSASIHQLQISSLDCNDSLPQSFTRIPTLRLKLSRSCLLSRSLRLAHSLDRGCHNILSGAFLYDLTLLLCHVICTAVRTLPTEEAFSAVAGGKLFSVATLEGTCVSRAHDGGYVDAHCACSRGTLVLFTQSKKLVHDFGPLG
jgi:hypothetical protein